MPDFSRTRYAANEIIKSDDMINGEDTKISNLNILVDRLFANSSGTDVIITGLQAQQRATPSMNVDITIGLGYISSEGKFVHTGSLFGPVAIENGDSTDRIDTLEVKFVDTDYDSQKRAFKDPSTGNISTQDHDTKTKYTLQAQVVKGTAGSGVAPTHTSGWMKIAEITVSANESTAIYNSDIKNVDAGKTGETNTGWTSETSSTIRYKSLTDFRDIFRVKHKENGDHEPDVIKEQHIDWGLNTEQVSAEDIPVRDSGGNFSSTEIESVLAEIISTYASTDSGKGASKIGIHDTNSRFSSTHVEDALQEIAGSGRTIETVKGNANDIASNANDIASNANDITTVNLGNIYVYFTNESIPKIGSGSRFDVGGALIKFSSNTSISGSLSSNSINYIYCNTSGSVSWSTNKPEWNTNKNGWYNSSGTSRCLGRVYYDGDYCYDRRVYTNKGILKYERDKTSNLSVESKRGFGNGSVQSWTIQSNSIDTRQWNSVTWSPELGLFCAVSSNSDSSTDRVMTSSDGSNWTLRTAPDAMWKSVTWSPELGLFCAVSSSGTDRIMTSPDGINWTLRTAPEANGWGGVTWSPELGLFCTVSSTGTHRIMTSPDGINWTVRNSPIKSWYNVVWSPELGLFCVNSLYDIMTSPDGINWTLRISGLSDSTLSNIAWSPELGLFCAVTYSGKPIMTSPDGINWTLRSNSLTNNTWYVTWSPELALFCAVSYTDVGTGVMTSPDGINWTLKNTPSKSWKSVIWSPELGLFCAVGLSGGAMLNV